MEYLDPTGLSKLISKITEKFSKKLTPDDSLQVDNDEGTIKVSYPVQGIVTQNEYNNLPDEKKNKGFYIIPDGGPTGDYGWVKNIYSTEEQVVGRWIDGRPLYRKTGTATMLDRKWTVVIPQIEGAEVKMFNAWLDNTGAQVYHLPAIHSDGSYATVIYGTAMQTGSPTRYGLCVLGYDATSKNLPVWGSIYYVKTTDPVTLEVHEPETLTTDYQELTANDGVSSVTSSAMGGEAFA